MIDLYHSIPLVSLLLGVLRVYQHWNDRIMLLVINDARQDTRLQQLEQTCGTFKRA